MPAPIAMFAFNRPDHLQRTLIALADNGLARQSQVTIFCDGPRTSEEKKLTDRVLSVARGAIGFASVNVVHRAKNMGCGPSIINGLTQMFDVHERLIVIEDDILCSPHTLSFLNEGLDFYKSNKKVFNIAAWSPPSPGFTVPENYAHDVYAIPRFNCWGWASWQDRFQSIDWEISDYSEFRASKALCEAFNAGGNDMCGILDSQMMGRINTWDIQADYCRFKNAQIGINPTISYVTNIGFGSGTHTTSSSADRYTCDISLAKVNAKFINDVSVQPEILQQYRNAIAGQPPASFWRRFCKFFSKVINAMCLA